MSKSLCACDRDDMPEFVCFFRIIRQEGETDVFRGSATSASDSSDSDSGEQSDSSVDVDAESIEP